VRATKGGADAATPLDTIDCTYQIDNPHQSGTPGFENFWNVHAHWKCTGANNGNVDTLSSAPRIHHNGDLQTPPPAAVNHGKNNIDQNAAGQCDLGAIVDTWYGEATGYVKYPPGYSPPDATLNVSTSTFLQGVNCSPPSTLTH
jgi:hypothetical protein